MNVRPRFLKLARCLAPASVLLVASLPVPAQTPSTDSFNRTANGTVTSLAVQPDGMILLAGQFRTLGGNSVTNIGRLFPDGSVDTTFNPAPDSVVYTLALQADGKTLVVGNFTVIAGHARAQIARLDNTEIASQNLAFDGSTITWTRGGASPEAWRTTFDYSPDAGASWTNLGGGVRVPGAWQLAGLSLPLNVTLRARAYTAVGGGLGESSWFIEFIAIQPLAIADASAAAGQFCFNVTGPLGQSAIIDASTDLILWTPIPSNSPSASIASTPVPSDVLSVSCSRSSRDQRLD